MATHSYIILCAVTVILCNFTNATQLCYNITSCDSGGTFCNPYSGSCGTYCVSGCEYVNIHGTQCLNITESDIIYPTCPTDCYYDKNANKCSCINTTSKCPNNCIYNSKTKQCIIANLNSTLTQYTPEVCEPYIYLTCFPSFAYMYMYNINVTSIPSYYENMQRGINNINRFGTNGLDIMYPVRLANDFNNIKCKYSPGNTYNQYYCDTYAQVCCNR